MLRASAAAEKAGVPSSSLVCEGFIGQAGTTSVGLGLPNLPVALVPGHVGTQSTDELNENVLGVTVDDVVRNLTEMPDEVATVEDPEPHEIVFSGTIDEINRLFVENEWSDGLPIIPPTAERVQAFLAFTDCDPDEVLAILLPDSRAATIWSVAVNGVMAGCRPEYMPVLIALIEAMGDPDYGVEHSGNTPGGETLITINGPVANQLRFNDEQGVLRDGFQPNTSVGRFWRLALRNLAGFLLHKNDKCTFGNTWRVVMAENEEVLDEIGWPTTAEDLGIAKGKSAVSIARYTGSNLIASATGNTGEKMMPFLADAVLKQNTWQLVFTIGTSPGTLRPLLVLSPILAKTLAKDGWTKERVKQYLYDHCRIPAWEFERYLGEWTDHPIRDLKDQVNLRRAPREFAESDDPNRMVPITFRPDDFMVAVSGDPLRTNAITFAHNGILGYSVAREIVVPEGWEDRLRAVR
ncbi:MAG: hypothetical protein HOK54_19380 [Alphaproteobacteria bacterium]|nr:hypothetical protein [Alphaproteobacteria bacterium]